MPETCELVEHLFRRQSGRIVAHLTRLLGPPNLDIAEEAVQDAMLRALQTWPHAGVPEHAVGWLFRVAQNAALDVLRRRQLFGIKSDEIAAELVAAASQPPDNGIPDAHLRDDELRMIFMCCHPAQSRDSSVALSLKTIGGFSVREIARAFLSDDAAVAQRLVRAKRQIREKGLTFEMPEGAALRERVAAVLDVIYLMFNEGYAAHGGEDLIRIDLCMEALRLVRLIAESSIASPRVHALAALLAFQSARLPARVDEAGDLIVLDDQDRSRWDQRLIALAFHHFVKCSEGEDISEYHIQAAIAATHARAREAASTDWGAILKLYDELVAFTASPVVLLNRAVAAAKVHGPAAGLAAIAPLENDPKLRNYYLLLAVRGHFLLELGRSEEALACYRAAVACECSEPERRFLRRKQDAAASLGAR